MQFPKEFFEDEVREGFFVPSIMKRCWAAQLEVLEDVDRVCQKHNIQYFAAWGTMLGAYRHGGYIPWDDDFDIAMLRPDYERFMQIAQEELAPWYEVVSFDDITEEFNNNVTRINSGRSIRVDQAYVQKFHGCPYVVGLDVFVYDFMAPTEEEEEEQLSAFSAIQTLAQAVDYMDPESQENVITMLESKIGMEVKRDQSLINQFLLMASYVAARYHSGDYVTSIWHRMRYKEQDHLKHKIPYRAMKKVKYVPFEHGTIPVPADIETVLERTYASYMTPVRRGGAHDYPAYRAQEQVWLERGGVLPFHWFSFDRSKLPVKKQRPHVVKELLKNLLAMLQEAGEQLPALMAGEPAEAVYLLEDLQDAVISIGNNIEALYGEGHPTIATLEAYCEALYLLHEAILDEMEKKDAAAAETTDAAAEATEAETLVAATTTMTTAATTAMTAAAETTTDAATAAYARLAQALTAMTDSATAHLLSRKEIIFLPVKYDWWDTMAPIYQAAKADPTCDVYVMPLLYSQIELDGSYSQAGPICEADRFPEGIVTGKYTEFAWEEHSVDVIYIQDPMDGDSLTYSVDPRYYSHTLATMTDHLVYVPHIRIQLQGAGDILSYKSMMSITNTPGVTHADWTVVESEAMRQLYLANLTAWAGADTADLWADKIRVAADEDIHAAVMRWVEEDAAATSAADITTLLTQLLPSLQELALELPGLIAGRLEDTILLLEDIQAQVIGVGNEIEAAYGEGHAIIPSLEAYCEALYVLHQALFAGAELPPTIAGLKGLQAALDEISQKIEG